MEEGFQGSEKQAAAAKKLAKSGSKSVVVGARGQPTPPVRGRGHGHGRRRWSSATNLDIETAPALTRTAAVLGRSYSTTTAIYGGVQQEHKQQQAAREGEGEGEQQRPRRRCGAGARLSMKIKELRTRFYIMRRCVAMLVCWRDDRDE